jgi:hypothetical protein
VRGGGGRRADPAGVDEDGRVDLGALDEALAARPCVVSVMWANNEVGTIEPVAEIARAAATPGVVFHTDAVQAFGKLRVRVDEVPCDLLALSAHKIGGPKGIGALYIREGTQVLPLVHGGGQERELRPGTENVAAAVGFAVAAELAAAEQEREAARLLALRDRLEAGLRARSRAGRERPGEGRPAEHPERHRARRRPGGAADRPGPGRRRRVRRVGLPERDRQAVARAGGHGPRAPPARDRSPLARPDDDVEEIDFAPSTHCRVIEQLRVESGVLRRTGGATRPGVHRRRCGRGV